ncbi:type II secretion system protein N [Acinetobacter oleivorans]|uniref:type II secretion system protein N n=1 Tax=Acinetobacter oleivorans TaxID=1148157 RepID=UPI000E852EE6|nr:type II secretion system protein N [Acinetobacter oleivorans]HBU86115.1 general secretion pathway protein [Acinetobacter sp.]MBE2173982.1 type II secretion system protein N [Acinetobacter oleivorans]MBJ8498865.1 type II secretion system protein N [Acinetobacter oleivorans]MBO9530297.1 type II secretion system protein N [Acinetobacter oleivorans]MDY7373874.1 type II secretion system protein N [Acinetobacter oleivorans]
MKKKSKQWKWWLFALIAFLIFIILQIPATWLISKFSKNNQTLHNVSGNIWQGQADWRRGTLRGSIHWKTRPLDLFLLRFAADVDIHSGNTQLSGVMGYGVGKKVIVKAMNGQVAPETLKQIVNWQWPVNSIQLKDINFNYKKEQGFAAVDGQLHWGGGALIYSIGDRQDRMNMPSLNGQLTDQNGQLQVDIRDQRSQKMANLLLDANMMLDVQLTQRLLLNIPSYDGKAGLDTFVISSRQPLIQGGN